MDDKAKANLARQGESLATNYIITKGYQIASRNFHSAKGEIDIIALNQDEILFIEVKTRNNHNLKYALSSITNAKQKKITHTAMNFLYQNPQLSNLSCRFDVILVFYYSSDDTFKTIHYPDAFKPIINPD
jgi:putative endonuclease